LGYKSELQSNNIDLRDILNQINALPEGGSGDSLAIPDEYNLHVEMAKELYTGEYAYLAILESESVLNVAFLMADFTITSYNEKNTEFTAIGWLYCEYDKDAQTWRVVDYRTEASTGTNYVKHIRYSSTYWYYNGQVIWPVGAGGGGSDSGGPPNIWSINGACADEAYAGTFSSIGSVVIE
jgi:hypothetical protein